MKVKELIELLQKLDQEKEIKLIDQEWGETDIESVDNENVFHETIDYYIIY